MGFCSRDADRSRRDAGHPRGLLAPPRENAMLTERHFKGTFHWPKGIRTAVTLTFDFQGGEDVRPLPDGSMDHEEYTQCEYGPHTGIWRILRLLEEEKVKATFNTCGGIAERYADAVKAIVDQGHEIAGHGYHHEGVSDAVQGAAGPGFSSGGGAGPNAREGSRCEAPEGRHDQPARGPPADRL